MSYRRDNQAARSALFDGLDGIEEGGLRVSSSYSIDINEHDNEKAIDTLKDKVSFLKRLTGDIHDEVLGHNRLLDRMGNSMDASRGILSRTVNHFKMVIQKKSSRKMCILVASLVTFFVVFYNLIRLFLYFHAKQP